jgi:methyl-accepting chemotaxis protein
MSHAFARQPADPAADHTFFDVERRLAFLGLNGETRVLLTEAWQLVEPGLPAILADFYARMLAEPAFSVMLTAASVPGLKQAQTEHWRGLFSGRFDSQYMARVTRVGIVHHRIGLEPRWYMGGYAFIQERLLRLIALGCRGNPERAAALSAAVVKAVTLDMDLAIAVYFRAMEEAQAQRLAALAQAFDSDVRAAADGTARAADELRTTASTMSELSLSTQSRAHEVTSLAETTAASVQSVAAAAEQMTAAIAEIGRQACHSAARATEGVDRANRTADAVGQLAEAAGRIADVARMIGSVASQTNMLALNATIEAARAGEAGRGFAVVAGEVKNLATQTAHATQAIGQQVATIHQLTRVAMDALEGMGGTVASVAEAADAIASAVEEQSAATSQISNAAAEAAASTGAVSDAIRAVNEAARQGDGVSRQVLAAADGMSDRAAGLTLRVGDFLAGLRSP